MTLSEQGKVLATGHARLKFEYAPQPGSEDKPATLSLKVRYNPPVPPNPPDDLEGLPMYSLQLSVAYFVQLVGHSEIKLGAADLHFLRFRAGESVAYDFRVAVGPSARALCSDIG